MIPHYMYNCQCMNESIKSKVYQTITNSKGITVFLYVRNYLNFVLLGTTKRAFHYLIKNQTFFITIRLTF